MHRTFSLLLMSAALIFLGGNAMGEIAGRAQIYSGDGGTAPDACMRAGASASKAVGLVARVTDTGGRFAVEPVEGAFRPGAEVAVYTPGGDFVGRGTVHSVYGDDLYVDDMDAIDAPGDGIGVGFIVFEGYTGEAARRYAVDHKDALKGMGAEARREATEPERGIAAEYR